ncbi:endonuclease [Soonwooa sp.]|uniref:endonuclease/exonuclease/phosphatase family protein n=1 Tax=Soonwooa sp. TaxID=1938592 RepID=UPI0035B44ACF
MSTLSELFMFYNVENFFPAENIKYEKSISGLYNWDDYKYGLKLRKIKNVFNWINEDFGQIPSIIGLAEIGGVSVLEDLQQEDSPLRNHQFLYKKSNDSRGLSVALFYDEEKLKLKNFYSLSFSISENLVADTRDILQAEFEFNNENLHVFILHLPSQRLQDEKKNLRNKIIEAFKNILSKIIEKQESIIIMGDFNENPNGEKIKELLLDNFGNRIFINPFENLFSNNQFSSYYGSKGLLFDQILYSKNLLEKLNFTSSQASIFQNEKIRVKNSKHPLRTYSGSRYLSGFSDHFPVLLKLEK